MIQRNNQGRGAGPMENQSEKRISTQTPKKPAKRLDPIGKIKGFIKSLAVTAALIAGICVVVSQQAALAEQREETARMEQQLSQIRAENDELLRVLNSDNEEEYMERIAIERLGYAYPGERRFYAMNTTP